MKMFKQRFSISAMLTLAACGGGGSEAGSSGFGGGSGGGTTVTPVVTMELRLVDQAGATTSNVLAGQPVRAKVVLRRNGVAVADEIVQFEAEQTGALVKIDPVAGSQLTDSTGEAQVTVSSLGTSSGAGRIKATAKVGTLTATASANFFATSGSTTPPTSLTLSALEIGGTTTPTTVSAYGTTGVEVQVLQAGVPYTAGPVVVNFTTSCPAGKATITANATTQLTNGRAVATFVDNGCAQTVDSTVTVTASISTDAKSASMTVRSPTTGSLRFVTVVPADKSITLRGQGGNGRQENATVTFQLVDVAGQGVGNADVCFDISTYIGGLNVDGFSPTRLPAAPGATALCGTDNLSVVRYVKRTNPDGTVAVQINSGTVPTPVRVRARALYPAVATVPLESFSDTLSVSTGLPLQRSFSLSVDKANIDGGNFDGEVAVLTARLADQFSNPVPDGTVINFVASGAAVCTSNNGSCRTSNGVCSCNVVSQARRPLDNRIVVTAYAVGLEDFDDRDGDNAYTPYASGGKAETVCVSAAEPAGKDCFYDLGDAYVDANKTGTSSPETVNTDTDIRIPYQSPATFTAAGDGTRGTAHIRASAVIYLSLASSAGRPTAVLPLAELQQQFDLFSNSLIGSNFLRLQPVCPQGTPVPQTSVTLYLDDGIGNPMAAGTSVSASDSSANVSPASPRPNTVLALGVRAPDPAADLPNLPKVLTWTSAPPPVYSNNNSNVYSTHGITVRGVEDKCAGTGSFVVQVTSPRGGAAAAEILIEGQARGTGRGSVEVRYLDAGLNVTANARGSSEVVVTGISFANAAGAAAPTLRPIKCGTDGALLDPPESLPVCKYLSSGTKTITVETDSPPTSRSISINVF